MKIFKRLPFLYRFPAQSEQRFEHVRSGSFHPTAEFRNPAVRIIPCGWRTEHGCAQTSDTTRQRDCPVGVPDASRVVEQHLSVLARNTGLAETGARNLAPDRGNRSRFSRFGLGEVTLATGPSECANQRIEERSIQPSSFGNQTLTNSTLFFRGDSDWSSASFLAIRAAPRGPPPYSPRSWNIPP